MTTEKTEDAARRAADETEKAVKAAQKASEGFYKTRHGSGTGVAGPSSFSRSGNPEEEGRGFATSINNAPTDLATGTVDVAKGALDETDAGQAYEDTRKWGRLAGFGNGISSNYSHMDAYGGLDSIRSYMERDSHMVSERQILSKTSSEFTYAGGDRTYSVSSEDLTRIFGKNYHTSGNMSGHVMRDYEENRRAVEQYLENNGINASTLNRFDINRALKNGHIGGVYFDGKAHPELGAKYRTIDPKRAGDIKKALTEYAGLKGQDHAVKAVNGAKGKFTTVAGAWADEAFGETDASKGYKMATSMYQAGRAAVWAGKGVAAGSVVTTSFLAEQGVAAWAKISMKHGGKASKIFTSAADLQAFLEKNASIGHGIRSGTGKIMSRNLLGNAGALAKFSVQKISKTKFGVKIKGVYDKTIGATIAPAIQARVAAIKAFNTKIASKVAATKFGKIAGRGIKIGGKVLALPFKALNVLKAFTRKLKIALGLAVIVLILVSAGTSAIAGLFLQNNNSTKEESSEYATNSNGQVITDENGNPLTMEQAISSTNLQNAMDLMAQKTIAYQHNMSQYGDGSPYDAYGVPASFMNVTFTGDGGDLVGGCNKGSGWNFGTAADNVDVEFEYTGSKYTYERTGEKSDYAITSDNDKLYYNAKTFYKAIFSMACSYVNGHEEYSSVFTDYCMRLYDAAMDNATVTAEVNSVATQTPVSNDDGSPALNDDGTQKMTESRSISTVIVTINVSDSGVMDLMGLDDSDDYYAHTVIPPADYALDKIDEGPTIGSYYYHGVDLEDDGNGGKKSTSADTVTDLKDRHWATAASYSGDGYPKYGEDGYENPWFGLASVKESMKDGDGKLPDYRYDIPDNYEDYYSEMDADRESMGDKFSRYGYYKDTGKQYRFATTDNMDYSLYLYEMDQAEFESTTGVTLTGTLATILSDDFIDEIVTQACNNAGVPTDGYRASFIRGALSYVGKAEYTRGGGHPVPDLSVPPTGLDCSGYVSYCFYLRNNDPSEYSPRCACDFAHSFASVSGWNHSMDTLKPGDLLVKNSDVEDNHVVIYIGMVDLGDGYGPVPAFCESTKSGGITGVRLTTDNKEKNGYARASYILRKYQYARDPWSQYGE